MTSFSDAGKTSSILSQGCDWLALAASPIFAVMAWGTAGNMATMYLLMSLFHLSAWLRLGTGKPRTHNEPTTKGD